MTFSERLVELRIENGYTTRASLAEKMGIPVTTLKHYEDGDREPGHIFLKNVSELFNVSVDYLLGLTDNKEILHPFRVTNVEQSMVEKYRTLDEHGTEVVDTVLEAEYKRCSEREECLIPMPIEELRKLPLEQRLKLEPYIDGGMLKVARKRKK